MASFTKAMKNLFWQSGDSGVQAEGAPAAAVDPAAVGEGELSDEDFAALLAGNEHAVPADAVEPVEPGSVEVTAAADGAVAIDFQAQYDAAGIPDTDEVEQLENFLTRLDPALPHASKIAAAEAFLGAIGKDAQAVLGDAERKIKRVHGIFQSQQQLTEQQLGAHKAEIDALQARIDEHRQQMEGLNRQLEGVRHACTVEESRLQAARVFFGSIKPA